jgi:acetyltransferase-like isoleucine patch superfamily enzyme
MLATDIELRTGDSHSIIDLSTNSRINMPASIVIEDHVWIGSKATILKGVQIGANSIVGTGSLITKAVPSASIVAGIPGKVLKSNVSWKRERI